MSSVLFCVCFVHSNVGVFIGMRTTYWGHRFLLPPAGHEPASQIECGTHVLNAYLSVLVCVCFVHSSVGVFIGMWKTCWGHRFLLPLAGHETASPIEYGTHVLNTYFLFCCLCFVHSNVGVFIGMRKTRWGHRFLLSLAGHIEHWVRFFKFVLLHVQSVHFNHCFYFNGMPLHLQNGIFEQRVVLQWRAFACREAIPRTDLFFNCVLLHVESGHFEHGVFFNGVSVHVKCHCTSKAATSSTELFFKGMPLQVKNSHFEHVVVFQLLARVISRMKLTQIVL